MPFVRERDDSPSDAKWRRLTVRENQVFDLINQGKTNKEIGSALCISERTAKLHVSNILHKRNVATRLDLFRAILDDQDIYGLSGC